MRTWSGPVLLISAICGLLASGGVIFSILERPAELYQIEQNKMVYKQMQSLYAFKYCSDPWFKEMDFCKDQKRFQVMLKDFFNRSGNSTIDQGHWTFFGSLFFVCTLLTTLGYGTIYPGTTEGQLFTIIFAIIGIPTMAYALSVWGRFAIGILMHFDKMRELIKTRPIIVWGTIFLFFMLLGGGIMALIEQWSIVEGLYFSACSMLTVGFGGLIPSTAISKAFALVFIAFTIGIASTFVAYLTQSIEVSGQKLAQRISYGSTDTMAVTVL